MAPISDYAPLRRSLYRVASWRSPDCGVRGRLSFYSFSLSLSPDIHLVQRAGFSRSLPLSPANVVEGVYRKLGRGCQKRPRRWSLGRLLGRRTMGCMVSSPTSSTYSYVVRQRERERWLDFIALLCLLQLLKHRSGIAWSPLK